MISSPKSLRILNSLSVVLLLAAIALFVWPVHATIPTANAPVQPANLGSTPIAALDNNDVVAIVEQNILSGSRHAPTVRYNSPDLASAADYSLPPAFAAPASVDSQRVSDNDTDTAPSLYGIVNSDGTWRALLRLDENEPNPVLLREGDRRGSYRVVTIRPKEVVVAGPSGQRTLRLARPPRNDSTGKSL